MITKNIEGNNISQAFKDAINDSITPYVVRFICDNAVLDCSIKSVIVTKGSVGAIEEFNIGTVVSSQMVAEVVGLDTAIKGKDIELQVGLCIGGGAYEYIKLGVFTVSEANKTIYSTTITGFGATVGKTTGDFTSPQDKTPPQVLSLSNIASEIAEETGVDVSLDSRIDSSAELVLPMSGLKTYQALQILASVVGGYASETNDGDIEVRLYDGTVTHDVDAGVMKNLPEAEEYDFMVTGVSVNTSAGKFKSLYNINLATDAQWLTYDMFEDYESNIVGYSYRPASLKMILGDPRLEGDDVLRIVDVDGITTYRVPCHEIVHKFSGGLTTSVRSAKASGLANKVGTGAPLSGQIEYIQQQIDSGELDGESAITLRIDSSRGTVFKNSAVSTVLNVAIYYKEYRIVNIATLREVYDSSAYLQWYYQGFDEDIWHTLASSDSRLSNDGFTLTLTPQDVDTKIVFQCNLIAN